MFNVGLWFILLEEAIHNDLSLSPIFKDWQCCWRERYVKAHVENLIYVVSLLLVDGQIPTVYVKCLRTNKNKQQICVGRTSFTLSVRVADKKK